MLRDLHSWSFLLSNLTFIRSNRWVNLIKSFENCTAIEISFVCFAGFPFIWIKSVCVYVRVFFFPNFFSICEIELNLECTYMSRGAHPSGCFYCQRCVGLRWFFFPWYIISGGGGFWSLDVSIENMKRC